jgi:two-component system chemotaxis response regulator CheB
VIRAIVVDDSAVGRELVGAILDSDPEVDVVDRASNGAEAADRVLRLRPDVVTMDISMPGMDGFEATRRIMESRPTPIVLVTTLGRPDEIRRSIRVMEAGALTAVPRPVGPAHPDFGAQAAALIATVKAMVGVKLVRRRTSGGTGEAGASVHGGRAAVEVIGVAVSTGGPAALARLLPELRHDLPPILIAQHISRGFDRQLAEYLDTLTDLDVALAEDRERLGPGAVRIAPFDRHIGFTTGGRTWLNSGPPVRGYRPSGTVLFGSLAASGLRAAGVVLTGMGEDGVEGLQQLRTAGGVVIAQDEASSIVPSMPAAAVAAGVVNHVLSLDEIPGALAALAAEPSTEGASRA